MTRQAAGRNQESRPREEGVDNGDYQDEKENRDTHKDGGSRSGNRMKGMSDWEW